MSPFRPKRGLVSAQDLQYKDLPYKENIFLSAVHPPQRPWKFRLCGDNPGPLGCSIGRIGQPVAPALGATMIRPRVSRIGGRFILGDTGTFVFRPNKL